ncbi:Uncharacterized protein PECH_004944 [Penicillium ucsense]|uniref:Glutaminase n=1 Tax=Penicillium ucsense TaxID=2839758 RepID=A0A8J8W3C8_9EURO|nr:Uncharacterized protein PECM_008291 [Penicillium ucsense]KAF7736735.1 Uncharacterized protein PECH_004944 [Penicillium ucsense]
MYLDFQKTFSLSSLCSTLLPALCRQAGPVSHHPVRPPSYPLAVRNPYLSTWMPSDQVQQLPFAEPQFWAGQELGWSVIIRIDGQAWSLMGIPNLDAEDILPARVLRAEFTSTHTIFDFSAGPVGLTLDFFSPVSPPNYVRQSLPFSYMTVRLKNAWGREIQVYSDIDGRWTGQSDASVHDLEVHGELIFHALSVKDAPKYEEANDMALWGKAILASRPQSLSRLSALAGDAHAVRTAFAETGWLNLSKSSWSPRHIVALAHDLGKVSESVNVTFAIGYEREQAIKYLDQPYTGFYRSEFPTTGEALSFFFDDFDGVKHESEKLDTELSSFATAAAGPKYADIVALSLRQAWGGIDLTIPDKSRATSGVMAFIKELSSDGNVNTIDVIMPAFPIYWVMNPEWIRLLLDPVMLYLESGRWKLPYMIHDLGSRYPYAIGHDDQRAEPMPIEECGNLLILALAYVRATGDHSWSNRYLTIFQKYADYLVTNGIDIAEQLSSNDAAGPLANETNLAIKAAIGIKAYGILSGNQTYSQIGNDRADLLFRQSLGTNEYQTHFTLQYPGHSRTWKIPYNLYPDLLLDLQTFPEEAFSMGSRFFNSVRGEYGVALDNRQDWAKSDWNMWLAGTFEPNTRDEFVDDLWAFMTNGKHHWPFSDRYISTASHGGEAGVPILCRARPTVGGHYALLALKGPRTIQSLSGGNLIKRPQRSREPGYQEEL